MDKKAGVDEQHSTPPPPPPPHRNEIQQNSSTLWQLWPVFTQKWNHTPLVPKYDKWMMRAGGRLGGRKETVWVDGEEQNRSFSEVLARHDERCAQRQDQNLSLSFWCCLMWGIFFFYSSFSPQPLNALIKTLWEAGLISNFCCKVNKCSRRITVNYKYTAVSERKVCSQCAQTLPLSLSFLKHSF